MTRYDKANPIRERMDLHNGHVIEWKWFLQETRGFHWVMIQPVCWLDGYGSFV